MRKCLLAAFVGLLCATVVVGQTGPAPSSPLSPPPSAVPAPPPVIQPPLPVTPPHAPEMTTGIPELDAVLALPGTLGKPFTFVVVLLLVGGVLMGLTRRVMLARLHDPAYARTTDGRFQRHVAIGDLVVAVVALHAASEAVGVNWFSSLTHTAMQLVGSVFGLLGALIHGLLWVVAAGLVAYAISPRGRDLVLSLLGFFYLRWHSAKPSPTAEFDLGGGVRAHLARVDLLQSTMQAADGRQYLMPNAWLMRVHFNWDNEAYAAPDVTAPPTPPAPPVEAAFPADGYPGIAGTGQPK